MGGKSYRGSGSSWATERAALIALTAIACGREPREDDQRPVAAARARTLLPPNAFSILPAPIAGELERRRCVIPQSYPDSTPHNVIRGRFMSAVRTDVAVLCATDGTTMILVFPGEKADSVVELAGKPGEVPVDSTSFSGRAIAVVDSQYIRVRYERYGGPRPPLIEHEAINDIVVGKASVVWYWNGRRWLELQGAD